MGKENKKSGLATAGMVLGIIAIVLAFIPVVQIMGIILGALALIFGAIPLFKKKSLGKSITAVVLGVASMIIAITMLNAIGKAVDDALSPTETNSSETTKDNSDSKSTEKKAVFDGAKAYKKIKNGMTKKEVNKVTGISDASCTESDMGNLGVHEVCTYGNIITDDVALTVQFTDGKVSSKSKSNM